jgi:tetratricopeptide (TPR) repeat protein
MELTIEQALQQGVTAHKEGKLQDAERLYRAILESQPAHPDANHNLGLLAVSVNKAEAALPLFKAALEANPKIEQFWLSYIEAFIKEKQFKNAKLVIEQAKTQGVAEEKLNTLEAQLSTKTQIENVNSASPSQQQRGSLLEYYQNGRFSEAEKLAIEISHEFPSHNFSWKILGAVFKATGRNSEAVNANQTAVALSPQDAEAHYNLGNTLKELCRLDEAESSYNQAIALKPDFAETHYNFGNMLKEQGRLNEAESSYTQAIALKSDHAEAHYNLGITLQELGKLDEAEVSYAQAIALKPDYAEAHNNLGNALEELGRLDDAEASYAQAIALKPNYAEAHNNLGNTLEELGRLDDAEASYAQAIALKPDFALPHYGLSKILYIKGNEDLSLTSIMQANEIEPKSKDYQLMLSFMEARKSRKENEAAVGDTINIGALTELISNPLILNRLVEAELITSLYEMNSIQLHKTKRDGLLAAGKVDARYGNGIVSPDFNLFDDARSIIQKIAEDLTKIMMEAVKSDIYIYDSFFNILRTGGGTKPHDHLTNLDTKIALGLGKQKYSLVYYLSVGDQNCREPGILKLYEPAEDILPCEGMILIIPACRKHSAVYSGKTDRVMIGVNFYSL